MNWRDRKIGTGRHVGSTCVVHVAAKPGNNPVMGLLRSHGRSWPCRLGRSGITGFKREGDGATPAGTMALVKGRVRADRSSLRMIANRPLTTIKPTDGWCDAPEHPAYNRPIHLPFSQSHEVMHRTDRLYDLVFELDWNMWPRSRNRGSAIFFHIAPDDARAGTEGCIALTPAHMRQFLEHISRFGRPVMFNVG